MAFATTEDLKSLLTTAVEGGIGYWLNEDEGDVQNIQIHRDAELNVIEIQCETDVDGNGWIVQEITHTQIRKALNEMKDDQKLPEHWRKRASHFIFQGIDDHDADDADVIVQYAMFKQIVFG